MVFRAMPESECFLDEQLLPPEQRPENNPDFLLLSAALLNQTAGEIDENGKGFHGIFTTALCKVIQELPATAPVNQIFKSARALLSIDNYLQEPVMTGMPERFSKPLIPGEVENTPPTFSILAGEGGVVQIDGGTANGLYPGPVLEMEGNPAVKITVGKEVGLTRANATAQKGRRNLRASRFMVTRRVIPEETILKVYAQEKSFPTSALNELAQSLKRDAAGINWIGDPIDPGLNASIFWDGQNWRLEESQNPQNLRNLIPTLTTTPLSGLIPSGRKVFFEVPPSTELLEVSSFQSGDFNAIEKVPNRNSADYLLAGRLNATSQIAYALIRNGQVPGQSLPSKSQWVRDIPKETARKLVDQAYRFVRFKSWLLLGHTGGGEGTIFPYELALRKVSAPTEILSASLQKETTGFTPKPLQCQIDDVYDFVHLKNPEASPGAPFRQVYLYVFGIEQEGNARLLFPNSGARWLSSIPTHSELLHRGVAQRESPGFISKRDTTSHQTSGDGFLLSGYQHGSASGRNLQLEPGSES